MTRYCSCLETETRPLVHIAREGLHGPTTTHAHMGAMLATLSWRETTQNSLKYARIRRTANLSYDAVIAGL